MENRCDNPWAFRNINEKIRSAEIWPTSHPRKCQKKNQNTHFLFLLNSSEIETEGETNSCVDTTGDNMAQVIEQTDETTDLMTASLKEEDNSINGTGVLDEKPEKEEKTLVFLSFSCCAANLILNALTFICILSIQLQQSLHWSPYGTSYLCNLSITSEEPYPLQKKKKQLQTLPVISGHWHGDETILTNSQKYKAELYYILYTLAVSPSLGGSRQHKRNKQKQWGFHSVLPAMTRDPAEFGGHCWSNTTHPPPSSTTYVAS